MAAKEIGILRKSEVLIEEMYNKPQPGLSLPSTGHHFAPLSIAAPTLLLTGKNAILMSRMLCAALELCRIGLA